MPTLEIVEHINVFEQGGFGLFAGFEANLVDAFGLHDPKKLSIGSSHDATVFHTHSMDFWTCTGKLAEAGCTPPEIAAITGHSLAHVETILVKYLSMIRELGPVNWLDPR